MSRLIGQPLKTEKHVLKKIMFIMSSCHIVLVCTKHGYAVLISTDNIYKNKSVRLSTPCGQPLCVGILCYRVVQTSS